ncbi:MAG: surface-adhesin E family protein [Betaproteobacteria bacterium]
MHTPKQFACTLWGVIGLLGVLPNAAWAAKWEPITLGDQGLFYIDPKSITEEDGKKKVWGLLDYKKPQQTADGKATYLSVQSQVQVNCKMNMARIMHVTYHSGSMLTGQQVLKQGMLHEWLEIDPTSPVHKIARRIC